MKSVKICLSCGFIIITMLACKYTDTKKTEKNFQFADFYYLILRLENERSSVKTNIEEKISFLNGEIVYKIYPFEPGFNIEMYSLELYGTGIKVDTIETGSLSVMFDKNSVISKCDIDNYSTNCLFIANIHYPLIDKMLGYKDFTKNEKEKDYYMSFDEKFSGKITCSFKDLPELKELDTFLLLKGGAKVEMELDLMYGELGLIKGFQSLWDVDVAITKPYYLNHTIDIQPVFISYKPELEYCCENNIYASTGGSYKILREYSLSAWNKCCLNLNFLEPEYLENEMYRILSEQESVLLKDEFNKLNAIEVFFVENTSPTGLWGGGVCFSGGTANAKIIVSDANLPVNSYILAHLLGHAFGLQHPSGNSTLGTIMQPSGFCADSPPFQSNKNCSEIYNPLIKKRISNNLCMKHTTLIR